MIEHEELFSMLTMSYDEVDDYRLKKALRYITSHYNEKIGVQKLAALANLEPHYFISFFRQKTGLSPHQYLIKLRIRNAYNMLRTGEYTTGETAESCGYSDIYHFYKQFKTVTGITPAKCISRSKKPASAFQSGAGDAFEKTPLAIRLSS